MSRHDQVILGISTGHGDSSAALLVDGQLVAAVEEERFNRKKHYALFPFLAAQYCLKHAGLTAADVHTVAVARRPRNAWRQKARLLLKYPHLWLRRLGSKRSKTHSEVPQTLSEGLHALGLSSRYLFRAEHHLAHLASVRCLAPEKELALISFDGLGDFVSATAGVALGNRIRILKRVYFPDSLGFFYTGMTQYLGFPYFGDEFKVMGLSSYGQPLYLEALRKLIRPARGFGYHLNLEAFPILSEPLDFSIKGGQPQIGTFYNKNILTQLLGVAPRKPGEDLKRQHWDLAMSTQRCFEEVANHLLNKIHSVIPSNTIGLAGGCAHNSVWTGKIPKETPFTKIYVAPAAHDAGIAVGAALLASQRSSHVEGSHWALLGPSFDEVDSSASELPANIREQVFENDAQLIDWMTEKLSRGKILGLFRGRMEFGPRALGNRSILADPRSSTMRDKLNSRVKHRETFRPFAASVQWEHQTQWFKNSFYSPTMEAVFEVHPSKQKRIPAVVHADKTCRIQSVKGELQPFYWKLLDAFRKKTGVPMLINTSFNDSEPIVCTQAEALRCFAQTDMDHLVVENRVFTRTA